MSEIAILMAAGMGTRMRPLTETIPKPLVKVHGRPMIETVIEGLLRRAVSEIYIVTGYLKEQFSYLAEKYPQVTILVNTEYRVKNNISSVYIARKVLGKANCFICESDVYIADPTIFDKKLNNSCYYGRMQEGYSDDWVFTMDGERIIRVGKGGTDTYNMVGVAYLTKEDGKRLADAIEEAYAHPGHENLYWDEIVDANLDQINMTVEPVLGTQLVEIDTLEELKCYESM